MVPAGVGFSGVSPVLWIHPRSIGVQATVKGIINTVKKSLFPVMLQILRVCWQHLDLVIAVDRQLVLCSLAIFRIIPTEILNS